MGKAQRTKKFIIEKTAVIFNKKGYAGTSMTDITSATGLTKGSIYGNFTNKDEIAIEAFKYNLGLLTKKFASDIEKKATVIDRLMVYPQYYRNNYKSIFENGGCPILNTAIEADDTHPTLKRLVNFVIISWTRNLKNLISEGIASNEVKPETNAEKKAGIILALIEGGVVLAKTTGRINFFMQALDQVEEIILNELKKG